MPDDTSPDELARQFQAAISGVELDDLRALTQTLLSHDGPSLAGAERQDRGRSPRTGTASFRVRVDLDESSPPIWRLLDIHADVTLDLVHQVLQAAFAWTDSHLHRFALGGVPFERTSELFLCPFDVEEGDDGTPASEVRLDETLQAPGDVLRYVYDYGDHWALTIRLEEVRPQTQTPTAVCVDGRRAGPPENCGGVTDAASLAQVLDDPAHFDVDEVNQALRHPSFVLREAGLDPRLVSLANQLQGCEEGDDVVARLSSLVHSMTLPSHDEMTTALRPITWFLDRASGSGIALTDAGYLKPPDVEAICSILPTMTGWIGKNNRESRAHPLQEFRGSLQRMGLLRKYKGKLLTTRAGVKVRNDPGALWDYLAARLIPAVKGDFAEQSALLIVAHVASSPNEKVDFDSIARALSQLGWRPADRARLRGYDLYRVEGSPLPLLLNVGAATKRSTFREPVHPAAAGLAHYALLRG